MLEQRSDQYQLKNYMTNKTVQHKCYVHIGDQLARRSNNWLKKITHCYRPEKNTRKREFGVGCIVDTRCKENILGFQPISERICTLRMERKCINITFINTYGQRRIKRRRKGKMFMLSYGYGSKQWCQNRPGGHRCQNRTRKRISHNYRATQFAKHI